MEADDRRAREDAGERSELRERPHRVRLRERADGRGGARERVVRRERAAASNCRSAETGRARFQSAMP